MDIEQRNRLRAEAGLPLLDVSAETARLAKARLTRNLRITSAFVGLNSFISGQTETVGSGPTCGSGIQSEDSCEMKCEIGKIDDERAARILPPLSR